MFYRYYNATTKRHVKEITYRTYIAKGIKDICGYDKTFNELYKYIIDKSKRDSISDNREPEEIIESIKSKLRGNYECNEPSGEVVT